MTRNDFRLAYRAARLLPHKYACLAAMKNCDIDAFRAALRCRTAHVWRGGIECSKEARRTGYSFRKAVSIHLRAVKYRMATNHRPATQFAA